MTYSNTSPTFVLVPGAGSLVLAAGGPPPRRPWLPILALTLRAPALFILGGSGVENAGREGISYSDHYQEQGLFHRLMKRLREIACDNGGTFPPVLAGALAN